MGLLIYSNQISVRLQYICKFIFAERLNCAYSITQHAESFEKHDGPKINYSNRTISGDCLQLMPHGLLFEKGIEDQKIFCFDFEGQKAFFKSGLGYRFDIFAASFYLISRYEEYLPHQKDFYGRYNSKNSLAFKEGFFNVPLVDIWINHFATVLQQQFPSFRYAMGSFSFLPTYDIDIAFSYKNKGLLRNAGGFFKRPSLERLSVLAGFSKDPFDSYEIMDTINHQFELMPVYFFLVAEKNSVYDKNILPGNASLQKLIAQHATQYDLGIHPSWASNENGEMLQNEKRVLEKIAGKTITKSRQHFIKMDLPETYEQLLRNGITGDYSMGSGSINGFRASTASAFYWYNLKTETVTQLKIHPFCFMDANSFYEQKFTVEQAAEELLYYYRQCRQVNGQLITIFHNNFLGNAKEFTGWAKMYKSFIAQVNAAQ
ncbi:MAG: hypothetical protein IPO46_07695 [Chitinophagaceae bacterium]|jgi:hypothetical protein|nr:hypothetical protein [Chitinophagaceae bacterium]MBP6047742.1 hypothetical protein [Ferruginibacter sp.]MBK8929803.1 hypothetical protein [Chitinophagaceae bacterium]MBP6988215.1 hypothetical protein [Ferruginibacter sp.]MBP7717490.1 hypothetical protein [Ferruginibacter sp.]